MRVTVRLLVLLAAAGPVLAACGGGSTPAGAGPSTLRVAAAAPLAPFTALASGGTLTGLDADVVRAVAATWGATDVELVRRPAAAVLPEVSQSRFDLAAGGLRADAGGPAARRVAFSAPYLVARPVVVVAAGARRPVPAGLDGARVGVSGSPPPDLAAALRRARLRAYPTVALALAALRRGELDAVVSVLPLPASALTAVPRLRVAGRVGVARRYVMAFSRENTALRDLFDRGLAQIRRDGTQARIVRRWLGGP